MIISFIRNSIINVFSCRSNQSTNKVSYKGCSTVLISLRSKIIKSSHKLNSELVNLLISGSYFKVLESVEILIEIGIRHPVASPKLKIKFWLKASSRCCNLLYNKRTSARDCSLFNWLPNVEQNNVNRCSVV